MFVGHYAVAFAAKRSAPKTNLGAAFLAVQFLDILWAPLILIGVEKALVQPGFLPASSLNLYWMPWTHGLVTAVIWSWFGFRLTKSRALGVCVFSHWVLDFIAHGRDLPLLPRGYPRVGLGLWRFREATFAAETLLLLTGLAIYLGATRAKGDAGRFAVPVFTLALIALGAFNLYGPGLPNITWVAAGAEACYVAIAAAAWRLDGLRVSE